MALRFYANTTSAAGNTSINNYSRVSLGNFALTTNQITLAAYVNITDWNPAGNDIRVIVKQNITGASTVQPATFRSIQTASTSSSVNALSIAKPAGLVAGDLLIVGLFVTVNDANAYGTIAYPSGFTQSATVQAYENGYNKLFVAYKIATSSDVAATNFTFTHTPASGSTYRIAATLAAYSNVDQTNPLDVQPTTLRSDPNVAGFNMVAPSITPSNSEPKRLLSFYGVGGGQGITDGYDTIPPASQTERGEITGGAGGYGRLMLADEAYASASPTGTRTATITNVGAAPGTFNEKASFCISVLLRSNTSTALNNSPQNYQWYLGLNRESTTNSPKTVAARFNYTNATLFGTTPLQTNTWYHIAAVYDNGVGRVYLNGNLEGTLTTFNPGMLTNDAHPVVIGNNAPDTTNILIPNSPNGNITQPAIWRAALTQSEIQSLALGVTPYKIRAASLASFVPQLGFNDIDVIRGTTLTKTNVETAADPRMFIGSNRPTKLKQYPVFGQPPTAPTLVVTPSSSSTITVVVSAVPPSGTIITSYLVQRATTPTGWINETTGTNSNNYEDFGLDPNTTYYYRAKYVLNDGRSSPWSTTQQATTSVDGGGGPDPLAPILTAISSIV